MAEGGKINRAKYIAYLIPIVVLMFVPYFMGVGMQSGKENNNQKTADMVYAVLQANRVEFNKSVLDKLSREHRVIKVNEHWVQDKTLPLPEQMLQMSSAQDTYRAADLNYSLQSLWAINQDNFPRSDKEREGLIYILKNPGKNYYTTVEENGRNYFMAVYPDMAISQACVQCHNSNNDSPKQDFQVGDMMGGVVVRIPLV